MKNTNIKNMFLNEKLMRNVSLLSVIFGFISLTVMFVFHELTLLKAFEIIIKQLLTLLTLWTFTRLRWDVTKGLMGSLLFALLYQESFLVLGNLWDGTSDFDLYLTMGVQGSLYLAAQSMSFMMTFIIIINHFVIGYSNIDNWKNVVLNQLTIVFKIILYISLLIINGFLSLSMCQQLSDGFQYAEDLCIIIMLICVEIQLNNFNSIMHELRMEKHHKEVSHE